MRTHPQRVRAALAEVPGVTGCEIDWMGRTVTVDLEEGATVLPEEVERALREEGFGATAIRPRGR